MVYLYWLLCWHGIGDVLRSNISPELVEGCLKGEGFHKSHGRPLRYFWAGYVKFCYIAYHRLALLPHRCVEWLLWRKSLQAARKKYVPWVKQNSLSTIDLLRFNVSVAWESWACAISLSNLYQKCPADSLREQFNIQQYCGFPCCQAVYPCWLCF